MGVENLVYEIFWTNFFRDVSKTILYNAFPEISAIPNPETIIGVLVGLSILDRDLVRVNLLKLVGGTNKKLINGLFGVIINNPLLENDIKLMCKKVKIKGDLTMNLMKLTASYKMGSIFNAALKIWEQHWSSPKFIAAIVAFFNNDLTNARVFANYFGVDNRLVRIVLALATRRSDLLIGNYERISKILEFESENAVHVMTDIHTGFERCMSEWNFDNNLFTAIDRDVTKGLFVISRFGIKMKGVHNQFDVPVSIIMNLNPIFNKIWLSIGLKDHKNIPKDVVKESKAKLYSHLNNLIMAVWDDFKGITYFEEQIEAKIQTSKDKLNKIWTTFPSKTTQILQMSFNKVFKAAILSVRKINSEANQKMEDNKMMLFQMKISRHNDIGSQK